MKIRELLEDKSDRISDFLDRWYSEHESIKSSEIEGMLKDFPQFSHSGYVERWVGIPADVFVKNDLADGDDIDTEKTEEYIAEHEPNRYVSGCASDNGLSKFFNKGGLDSRDYNIVVGYEVKNGLYLKKMVGALANPNSHQELIAEVDEIIFIPRHGEISSWQIPEK